MTLQSFFFVFFFKQKTAYEMRISDWSSDVCSSDLDDQQQRKLAVGEIGLVRLHIPDESAHPGREPGPGFRCCQVAVAGHLSHTRNAGSGHETRVGNKLGGASCRARVCQYV